MAGLRVAVITVSDSSAQGIRPDKSGPAVVERCRALGWDVGSADVLPDDQARLEALLVGLADLDKVDLIVTTGGTGLGPRDVTPEATMAVCAKLVPGLGEVMRAKGREKTARAVLSRAVVGVRGRTLIVNLPGSPKGAVDSLDAVADVLPHSIEALRGARHD